MTQSPEEHHPDLEALRAAIGSGDPLQAMPAITQLRFCSAEEAVPPPVSARAAAQLRPAPQYFARALQQPGLFAQISQAPPERRRPLRRARPGESGSSEGVQLLC